MLIDSVKDLILFTKIVKMGTLCAAGRELGFSSALVSKRLKRLEELLQVRLINRSTRTLSVTSEGAQYFEYCIHVLSKLEEAEMVITQQSEHLKGTLKITMPSYFGQRHISPLLTQMNNRHPDLNLALHMSDEIVDIICDGYDVAIRIDNMSDTNLIAKPLGIERRVVVATPEYLEKYGTPETPEDLEKHNALLYANPDPLCIWSFIDLENIEHVVKVTGNYKINNCELLKDAVLSGAGICLRPTWDVWEEVQSGALKVLLPEYTPPSFNIQAVYPSRHHLSMKVKTFVKLLKDNFEGQYVFSGDSIIVDRLAKKYNFDMEAIT